jgi:hypothetical protein
MFPDESKFHAYNILLQVNYRLTQRSMNPELRRHREFKGDDKMKSGY